MTNDFFKVLVSMDYEWRPHESEEMIFDIVVRGSGEKKYVATRNDLIFGANTTLRQVSELYARADGEALMVEAFVRAWTKVMMGDRFDVPEERRRAFSIC